MELREQLELIEVVFENDNKKAVLTFLDEERGEIREVNFNKQIYDNGQFVDDEEKAKKVDTWCAEFFGFEFENLSHAIGVKKDIYCYEKFNSLFEGSEIEKFTKDQEGDIFETTIKEIIADNVGIKIRFEHEGKTYESKMMYANYIEERKQFFTDPVKRLKQEEKFEKKYGVSIDNKDEIIGKEIMVEVKVAFKKFPYADIKNPKWNK